MSNVSEITQCLKEIIQANSDLQDIWTHGKISEVRPTQSGVLNFTLTDRDKKIECVIFNDSAPLQENLPIVGSNVSVKGQIYVYETISRYRFMITDIHLAEGPVPTPFVSINDLTKTLKAALKKYSPVKVQGEIVKVFVSEARFTILKLQDVAPGEQVNEVIECVLLPGIDPPFPLQQGERITVEGEFGTFLKVSAYRIEVEDVNNIKQVTEQPIQGQTTPNECQKCKQRCEQPFTLCPICYYAQVHHEGIVVGAVTRYFDSPRFSNFSTQREYEIRFGVNIIGRADVALLNSEGNPVAIAECKKIGNDGNDGNDGIVQLEGYINPTAARLGLFADNTDPYEWTFFIRNREQFRFDKITRSQFERELGVDPASEIPTSQTRLELIRRNIIETEVDAIVITANPLLTRVSGVEEAVWNAGGEAIEHACREIIERKGFRPQGHAEITTGGNLPARHIIHAVGPIYDSGENYEAGVLASCYKSSLRLAVENGIRSIAFPAISTGSNFRYPVEEATPIALNAVKEFVEQAQRDNEMVPELIQFVLFDREAYNCYVRECSNLGFGLSCLIGELTP